MSVSPIITQTKGPADAELGQAEVEEVDQDQRRGVGDEDHIGVRQPAQRAGPVGLERGEDEAEDERHAEGDDADQEGDQGTLEELVELAQTTPNWKR